MFQGRKIITILVSLIGSVLLWIYVVTNITPEMNFHVSSIPVSIDGMSVLEERGLVITEQSNESLDLDIKTSRDNLSKLNKSTISIRADVSKIPEPGEYTLNCVVSFPDTVRSSNVVILRKSEITVKVERLEKKSFDIVLKTTGSVKEGYLFEAANVVLDPEQVLVTGLQEEIDRIAEVIVRFDISHLEETDYPTLQLVFLDEQGNELEFSEHTSFSVTQTTLTLPVYRTKTIQLKLSYVEGGGVTEENVSAVLSPESIDVKGRADKIDPMDDVYYLEPAVDLGLISNEEDRSFVLNLPVGVSNMSGSDTVQAHLSLHGVRKDSIDISDIRLTNVPEGMEVKLTTLSVRVNVRGGTEEIEEIKNSSSNGFYIEVDLSDYNDQTGALSVPGQVVNKTHKAVSVDNSVVIGIVLTQQAEAPNHDQE